MRQILCRCGGSNPEQVKDEDEKSKEQADRSSKRTQKHMAQRKLLYRNGGFDDDISGKRKPAFEESSGGPEA